MVFDRSSKEHYVGEGVVVGCSQVSSAVGARDVDLSLLFIYVVAGISLSYASIIFVSFFFSTYFSMNYFRHLW